MISTLFNFQPSMSISMLFEQFTLSLSMPKSVPKILTKLKGLEVLSKLNSEIIYI